MTTQMQLERQIRKLAGDGPAERQILLMKLQYEFDTAPEFGATFVADATSPPPKMDIAHRGFAGSREYSAQI